MIFCYKFNFQRIKCKSLLSKIEQVEMLIALGRGDKYRLTHIRETLERSKELYISDKDFLEDLVKTHLKDKIYQARIVSISEKPNLFCEECGSEISADEKFCTSCGTQKPEPSSPSTLDVPEPTPEPETKSEAGSGEQQASGGFAFTADGDVGESSTRETARESLTKKISELETRLDEQTKAIKVVTEKSEKIAAVANSLFEGLSQGISSMDDSKITALLKKNNSEIVKEKGITYLKVEDEKIKIDLNSSLPTTASTLFNESKKQKAAIGSIEKLLIKTENELEKVIEKGESAKSVSFTQVRKKNWFERYRWFYTTDGVLAVGGRDSSSNSAIIRKHLDKNDKVFHAEISGSPFFLLKDNATSTPASLTEVAHATVCFSKVWKEAFYGSSAYWVNPDQVKKGAPSGQSMAKGSFMIEGQRNFVKISSLKMCVAIIKHEESYLLTCGPPSMKNTAVCYAMIEPTGQDMADVAKRIRYEFLSSNEEIAKPFSIDDFVRVLPAGACKITESG